MHTRIYSSVDRLVPGRVAPARGAGTPHSQGYLIIYLSLYIHLQMYIYSVIEIHRAAFGRC